MEDPTNASGIAGPGWLERGNRQLREHPLLVASVLVLVTFAAYAPALANGFAFDDQQVIIQNPFVADPTWWRHIFWTPAWAFIGFKTWAIYYRPFQIFSYWLLWRLAGPNPGAYHLFQLILYAASVWLLFRVAVELMGDEVAAFGGALLWALHPLHVEAVAWAAALPDIGVGFFFLLALLLFLRAEREGRRFDPRHAVAAVALVLGLLFKENALSLVPLLIAYWFFLGKPEPWVSRGFRLVPYVAGVAAYIVIRVAVLGHFGAGPNVWRISRGVLASAFALMGAHLRFFVWPAVLSPIRSFNMDAWLLSRWPWAALVLLAAAWALRKREPLFAFFVFAWLIALTPCLDVRQITTPFAADRYSYLPTAGLCLAVAWIGLARLPMAKTIPIPIGAVTAALAVIAVFWTVSTEAAIPRWRNSEALMQYGLKADTNAAVPHIYKGMDLQYRQGDLDGAAREFRTAIRLNEVSWPRTVSVLCQADLSLGMIANLQGRPQDALKLFDEVLRLCPDGYEAYSVYDALGAMSFVRGDYAKAAEYFRKSVKWGPVDVSGHFYLGTCEMKLGHPREAAEQFRIVRQIDPSLRPAYMAEAAALEAAGDTGEAAHVRALAPR
ncbi:MAG TPA: tetratricopeptide repeat protein [Terriglobia bacterium]|nr:tetratricopeptide repeat protein [Terriglobia bacterium]